MTPSTQQQCRTISTRSTSGQVGDIRTGERSGSGSGGERPNSTTQMDDIRSATIAPRLASHFSRLASHFSRLALFKIDIDASTGLALSAPRTLTGQQVFRLYAALRLALNTSALVDVDDAPNPSTPQRSESFPNLHSFKFIVKRTAARHPRIDIVIIFPSPLALESLVELRSAPVLR
ncbi:hypothetical protein FA13DRAFT_1804007 [Coprinellus micaceus]|uniref:Uncharacterized protein n=1 Tax=Coprinellus micaceus TaxID=71717 RepID=A0A4Y7SA89_COPMI|nr:hypothetical protein FA13DRAFT_1804007 [Coprinellus micaceus]